MKPKAMKQIYKILISSLIFALPIVSGLESEAATKTNILYNCSFLDATTSSSYSQNKTFDLAEKTWAVSSYRCNSTGFFFGSSSDSNTSYSLDNEKFPGVADAWKSADSQSESATIVYALLFDNEYDDVTKISFAWSGVSGGSASVFLLVDKGTGFESGAKTETNAESSIDVSFEASAVKRFALVMRPGTETLAGTTGRALKLSTCEIDGVPTEITKMSTPTFSLDGTLPLWPGTEVVIATDDVEGTKINYSLDGTEYKAVSNPARIAIKAQTTVRAYASLDGVENSESAECTFSVYDLNGDFAQFDGGYPSGWKGGIASGNVSAHSDPTQGTCVKLTQTTKENKRLLTQDFILPAGTYQLSAYCMIDSESESAKTALEYVTGGSSSYKSVQECATRGTWTKLSGELVLTEQTQIKLSLCLASKSSSDDDSWSAYFTNVSLTNTSQPTSLQAKVAPAAVVRSVGGELTFKAQAGQRAEVYDLSGLCLARAVTDGCEQKIQGLPQNRLLVVRVGSESFKVIIGR